jgi:hypothetical protein
MISFTTDSHGETRMGPDKKQANYSLLMNANGLLYISTSWY